MDAGLKERLMAVGLTEAHVGLLEVEGVVAESDILMLTADDIRTVTSCGLIVARKVANAFAPALTVTVPTASAADPSAEIPEGAMPSTAQVSATAGFLGMDQSLVQMLMLGNLTGMSGAAGVEMDLSGMIATPQLVAAYDPGKRNPFYMIMGTLEARMGVPIIIINDDGSINRELTTQYIESLEKGFDAAEDDIYFDSEGKAYQIVAVGVDAQSIHDADPLRSERPLQANGMGIGRISWNGVGLDVKQVVYFAVKSAEIKPENDADITWLQDHIKPGVSRFTLQRKCPNAIKAYNEALRSGSLPTLRVMLNRKPRKQETMPRRRRVVPRDLSGLGRSADGYDSDGSER